MIDARRNREQRRKDRGAVAGPERGAQNARSGVLTRTPNGSYALVITPAARSWQ